MKVKLDLDILWKAIFTVYFVQMLRFETECILQMADYHGVLPTQWYNESRLIKDIISQILQSL
jgi:hypothetical protein